MPVQTVWTFFLIRVHCQPLHLCHLNFGMRCMRPKYIRHHNEPYLYRASGRSSGDVIVKYAGKGNAVMCKGCCCEYGNLVRCQRSFFRRRHSATVSRLHPL